MADKRISQLIERTDIANNDVLPIVASGATTTNKVTISTIQTWMQDNLDVGVTSVGLSMPSAFVVSNSPVTASGNITVTGAGTVAQYIRGDGSLADFPTGGGGGSSVSYYLNGSVSQGTIGGIAYLEMNKTPILGAGTDFTIAADGYIASFITDAGDPGLLEIPAGNWNFETYIQASSGGGSPTFYIELYKVNSGGTATLIASNSGTPESISLGTNINPYFSALAVPQTTLALTDRLALRYYVTHAGRTITLHTENNTLCQIITTFTTGLTALNGLTAQVQNFATGTSGTDFNISSAVSTHTFNIPSASATARGLVTTGSQTIAGAKTFSSDASFNLVSIGRGAGNQVSNTRVGDGALNANTTGTSNTAVGKLALLNNTTGSDNTSMGLDSMVSNTTGNNNVAFGSNALRSNNSNANTGIGFYSLYSNTTGSSNVALGSYSLYSNTTATGNTANGYYSLFSNTTGGSNTATGYVALSANTTGNGNTATGAYALENNTTGSNNTAVGQNALENNLVGTWNTAVGFNALQQNTNSSNTAIGHQSLQNNTTGDSNFAAGRGALELNTTGRLNTSVGFFSLNANTTGSFNVAVGDDAGRFFLGSGNQNVITNNSVFIGSQTRALGNNQTNQIVIGHNAVGNGSNTVTIGNDSITTTFLKGNISLKGENSAVKSIQYTNPSGTLHWSVQTSFGSAGEHQPFSIRNGVLGTDAILIQPASNNISFTGSLSSATDVSGARLIASSGANTMLMHPNIMGTNRLEAGGALPLALVSAQAITLAAGGTTPQITLSTGGAVTLTGALNGTSASFTGSIAATSNQTAPSDGSAYFYKSSAGAVVSGFQFLAETGGAGSRTTKLTIDSTGAATFSNNVTIGQATAATNVKLILSGVANKAAGIEFHQGGAPQWYIGNGIASEDNNFELFNSNGTMAMKIIKSTNAINFQGAATFSSSVTASNLTVGSATVGGQVKLDYGANAASRSWRLVSDAFNFGDFSIQQSTTQAGSTYSDRLLISASGAATFSSSVTAAGGFEIPNGQFYRARRTSGNLLTDMIGIPSGTNDVRVLTTGAFSVISGSNASFLHITDTGNVGIGTPSPIDKLNVNAGGITFTGSLPNPSNTSVGSLQIGYDGTQGVIQTWQSSPLLIATYNYQSFSTNGTERMRITSGGYLKASNDATYAGISSSYHEFNQSANNAAVSISRHTGTSPYGLDVLFSGSDPNNATNYLFGGYTTSGGFTFIYRIFSNGTVSARSDARWKKNIETARNGYIDDLCKLRVVKYNWYNHEDDAPKELGLIAQEVEEVFPGLVQQDPVIAKKEVKQEDGTIIEEEYEDGVSRSVKTSVLPFMLLKAMQEQQEQIKELRAEIEALKSQING